MTHEPHDHMEDAMIEVGSKVKVVQNEVAVIGKVTSIDEFRVVFTEEYAASTWGESDACAGRVHSVDPKDVEEV